MSYKEIIELLYNMMPDFQQVGAGAYKPGLERVERFCEHLDNPQRLFYTIHVAGTNGKGSVSHMIASVLTAAGYKTGLYTSPHLQDFRERMRIDGEMITEEDVVAFTEDNLEAMRGMKLSFFEATVGMAFSWFAKNNVNVAVIETGLGGSLDATNIVNPLLSIITNIGMDHMSFLGDTPEKIAGEKAGIIKHGVPVLIGQRDIFSAPVFETKAAKLNSEIHFAEDMFKVTGVKDKKKERNEECDKSSATPAKIYSTERLCCGIRKDYELDLSGNYQRHNIITALASLELLKSKGTLKIAEEAIHQGLAHAADSTGLRGRWHILGHEPLVVADTGHNAHGLQEVVRQIHEQHYEKLYMILGVADDKDLSLILPLLPSQAHYIFTQASVKRALNVVLLEKKAAGYGLMGEVARNVTEALERARSIASPRDMIFIGGSTFTVADLGI